MTPIISPTVVPYVQVPAGPMPNVNALKPDTIFLGAVAVAVLLFAPGDWKALSVPIGAGALWSMATL